jgi:hypothetical protein
MSVEATQVYNAAVILTGWKEICTYLHCATRSAQRWELGGGLPIKRPLPGRRSHVFADSEQLDSWLRNGSQHQSKHQPSTGFLNRFDHSRELLSVASERLEDLRLQVGTLRIRMAAIRATRQAPRLKTGPSD